jgi:hypothetical protein
MILYRNSALALALLLVNNSQAINSTNKTGFQYLYTRRLVILAILVMKIQPSTAIKLFLEGNIDYHFPKKKSVNVNK